jgi:hypothetical protein
MARRPDGYLGFALDGPFYALIPRPSKEPPTGVTTHALPSTSVSATPTEAPSAALVPTMPPPSMPPPNMPPPTMPPPREPPPREPPTGMPPAPGTWVNPNVKGERPGMGEDEAPNVPNGPAIRGNVNRALDELTVKPPPPPPPPSSPPPAPAETEGF